jgi:cytochrome c553
MKATNRFVIISALLLSVGPARAASIPPPGAASCSGCHTSSSTVQTTVPRLAGTNSEAIVTAMTAFKAGQRPATVMDRIAKGFSDDEIRAIAAWYATQK